MENIIKTEKGIEIKLDMDTLYSQLWSNEKLLSKKDVIIIGEKLGMVLKTYKGKKELLNSLLNQIYQSNHFDCMTRIYSGQRRSIDNI